MKKHFDVIALILVAALGPFFLFPKMAWIPILFASVLAFLGRAAMDKRFLPRTPLDVSIAALAVVVLINTFVVKEIWSSSAKLAGIVYGITFFFVLIEVLRNEKRQKAAIALFIVSGSIIGIVGILGRSDVDKFIFGRLEVFLHAIPKISFGFVGAEKGINPNALSGILLLFAPLAVKQISLIARDKDGLHSKWARAAARSALSLCLTVFALAILLSQSFGTGLGLMFGLVVLGDKRRLMKLAVFTLLIALILLMLVTWPRPAKVTHRNILAHFDDSLANRIAIWKLGLESVRIKPLTGIGVDQLRRGGKLRYEWSHAHNQFLHTAVELGIPGLIAYLALLAGLFKMARDISRSKLPEWIRAASCGLAAGQFGFAVFGVADAIPLGAKPAVFFWISAALIASFYISGRAHCLNPLKAPPEGRLETNL